MRKQRTMILVARNAKDKQLSLLKEFFQCKREIYRFQTQINWENTTFVSVMNCLKDVETSTYFLAPSVLFFSLIWLPWHFLHLVVEIGFLAPHLKHILKNNLRCCAICFFTASVIGIYTVLNSKEGSFLPFCSYISYFIERYKTISVFSLGY